MTSKEKLHEQELRRPDPLQVRLARILDSILGHAKMIAGVGFAGCLVVGGYYAYEQIKTNVREGRVEELSKIQIVYSGEEKAAADKRLEIQKKITALEPIPPAQDPKAKVGDTAPSTPPQTVTPEIEAQKKELTKQIEAIKADHNGSKDLFQAFAKKYEGEPEGWAAAMIVGKILLDQEKFPEAKTVYETVLSKTKQEPFYQIQAVFGVVGAYEELGEFDKGLAEIDQLTNLMVGSKETSTTTQALFSGYSSELLPKLLLAKAQLLMFKGNKEDAKKTLTQLLEQHSGAPQAQKARTMRALVN